MIKLLFNLLTDIDKTTDNFVHKKNLLHCVIVLNDIYTAIVTEEMFKMLLKFCSFIITLYKQRNVQ